MPTLPRRPIHQTLSQLGLCLVFALSFASAQDLPGQDSLGRLPVDSLHLARAAKRFIPFIGSATQPLDSSDRLHSAQFVLTPAVSLAELLNNIPGHFVRTMGQSGQPTQLTSGGVDNRMVPVLVDGRPMSDPITGTTNLYEIPIENTQEIEILETTASLFSAAGTGGEAVNIVSRQYDNNRPMTKLRFMQGPFEHLFTDGLYTQNVAAGTNVLFGIQRQVTDGRFPNSKFDSWNIRARVRYNLSDRINMWVSDLYFKSTLGLNGGVDPKLSPSVYDEVTAVVRDESTGQTVSRHDFTFGFAGKLLGDTISLSKVIAYYTVMDREYSTGATQFSPPTFSDLQHASVWGGRLEQRFALSIFEMKLGAEYELRSVDECKFLSNRSEGYRALMGQFSVLPFDWLTARGGIRFENIRGKSALPWSLRLETPLAGWLSLWGGTSNSFQYPTMQELYWTDSTISRPGNLDRATHTFAEIGICIESGPVRLSVGGFRRTVHDCAGTFLTGSLDAASSLVIRSVPTLELSGATIDAMGRFWRLEVVGHFSFTDVPASGSNALPYPRIISFGELFYRDVFGDNVLDLKVALRARFVSRHYGSSFIPRLGTFVRQSSIEVPGISSFDAYAVGKFGDAHITFVWENPLNTQGMLVPYYPQLGRNIKLGINWLFLD